MGTELKEGDRVKVREGKHHDEMTKGKIGTVRLISTPALGIEFDDMPGKIHKWYVDEELAKYENNDPVKKPKDGNKHKGM